MNLVQDTSLFFGSLVQHRRARWAPCKCGAQGRRRSSTSRSRGSWNPGCISGGRTLTSRAGTAGGRAGTFHAFLGGKDGGILTLGMLLNCSKIKYKIRKIINNSWGEAGTPEDCDEDLMLSYFRGEISHDLLPESQHSYFPARASHQNSQSPPKLPPTLTTPTATPPTTPWPPAPPTDPPMKPWRVSAACTAHSAATNTAAEIAALLPRIWNANAYE